MFNQLNSLRIKIVFLFLFSLFVILFLFMAIISIEIRNRYEDLFIQRGYINAEQLALKTDRLLDLGLLPSEFSGYEELCQEIVTRTEGVTYVGLLNGKGVPLFEAGTQLSQPTNRDAHISNILSSSRPSDFYIYVPLSNDAFRGSILVVVDESLVERQVISVLKYILMYGVITVFACGVGVLGFLKLYLGKPIESLVSHMRLVDLNNGEVESDELAERKDEIGLVARTFDDLIKSLRSSQISLSKSNAELQSLTEELEHRVERRTEELIEANKKLKLVAHTDALSGLSNRLQFSEVYYQRFAHAKRHAHNFSLLMIDLDRFKEVNDKYGHMAGDHVIEVIGQRIRDGFREGDSYFRMGGDEFVFLAEEYEAPLELRNIVEKVRSLILTPIEYQNIHLPIGVSIGVASLENDCYKTADELYALADAAMYRAKQDGVDYLYAADEIDPPISQGK